MVEYWLIPMLCLHILILCEGVNLSVPQPADASETDWASEGTKTPLTRLISKLLPSKLPQLEELNKYRRLQHMEGDLQTIRKRKPTGRKNNDLMQEQGFVEKNGTYFIDNNILLEHQEDLEEVNRAEKIANFDLVEGLNLMAERNENLDDVVDEVLLQDKNMYIH